MVIKTIPNKGNTKLNFNMKTNDGNQIQALSETNLEKDLDNIISNNLKWNEQAKHSAAKVLSWKTTNYPN